MTIEPIDYAKFGGCTAFPHQFYKTNPADLALCNAAFSHLEQLKARDARIAELETALTEILKHVSPGEESIPSGIRIDRVYCDAKNALSKD